MATHQPASPYQVLVVDDDRFQRTIIQVNLAEAGYSVTCAENGRDALQILSSGHYPLILTDVVMPEMGGLELCRAIRSRPSDAYTYIILLTAQATKEDIVKGLEAGADEYLIKPVNQAELTARLKTARRILELEASLKKSLQEITSLSVKDALTETYNRRYLEERLPQEIKRAHRYSHPLSVIMYDIDHFKSVNDRFGHHVGDVVLQKSAQMVRQSIRREIDWLARYGGEEFVAILPETDLAGATVVAERLRWQMEQMAPVVAGGVSVGVTASFGIASVTPNDIRNPIPHRTLLEHADHCLYQAKREGRNCIKGIAVI